MNKDVFIALGSNLGKRRENIQRALDYLGRVQGIKIIKQSSLIETKPQGGPPQGKYLNGVVKITTSLSAPEALTVLQTIETKLGRVRTIKNGPRTIDLDILIYGNEKIDTPDLVVPHPRMAEREFVMKPLREIEPGIENLLKKGRKHGYRKKYRST